MLGFSHLLLLDDGQLHSVALGQRDHRLGTLTDDEHVGETSGELVTHSIAHVHDIEGAEVAITTDDHTHTTNVVTLGDEAEVAHLELDVANDLVGLDVHLHGVVHLHGRIGEADRASVVRHDEGNLLGGQLALHNLAQLELGLSLIDAVEHEASLHIIEQTEAVRAVLKGDHIYLSLPHSLQTHETSGEGRVGAHLAIDLHQTLHADHLHFVIRQSVLQTVADDEQQRQALSLFMGTAARLRSPHTSHLVKHPVLRGVQTLHMLLRTTSLRYC